MKNMGLRVVHFKPQVGTASRAVTHFLSKRIYW